MWVRLETITGVSTDRDPWRLPRRPEKVQNSLDRVCARFLAHWIFSMCEAHIYPGRVSWRLWIVDQETQAYLYKLAP